MCQNSFNKKYDFKEIILKMDSTNVHDHNMLNSKYLKPLPVQVAVERK